MSSSLSSLSPLSGDRRRSIRAVQGFPGLDLDSIRPLCEPPSFPTCFPSPTLPLAVLFAGDRTEPLAAVASAAATSNRAHPRAHRTA